MTSGQWGSQNDQGQRPWRTQTSILTTVFAVLYSLFVLVTSSLLLKLFDKCQAFLSTFPGPPLANKNLEL